MNGFGRGKIENELLAKVLQKNSILKTVELRENELSRHDFENWAIRVKIFT